MWLINGSGNQQSHRTINLMEAVEEMKCTDLPPMVIEHNGRFGNGYIAHYVSRFDAATNE